MKRVCLTTSTKDDPNTGLPLNPTFPDEEGNVALNKLLDGTVLNMDNTATTPTTIKDSLNAQTAYTDASVLAEQNRAEAAEETNATAISSKEDTINATNNLSGKMYDATKTLADQFATIDEANYVTADASGSSFATNAALLAGPYYNEGSTYTPTPDDYAIVAADETHSNSPARYYYTHESAWQFQYILGGAVDLSGYALKATDFNTALTSTNKGLTAAECNTAVSSDNKVATMSDVPSVSHWYRHYAANMYIINTTSTPYSTFGAFAYAIQNKDFIQSLTNTGFSCLVTAGSITKINIAYVNTASTMEYETRTSADWGGDQVTLYA